MLNIYHWTQLEVHAPILFLVLLAPNHVQQVDLLDHGIMQWKEILRLDV